MGRRRERERALTEELARQRLIGRDEGRRQSFLSVLARIARRLFKLEVSEVVGVVEREGPDEAVEALGGLSETWADRWRDSFEAPIQEIFDSAPVQTDRGEARLSFDLKNDRLRDYFDNYVVELAGQISETTRKDITKAIREASDEGLSVPETAKRIEVFGEEFSKTRSQLIAQNELLRASKFAAHAKARESGVISTRRYLTAHDSRVRPEHVLMDGEERGIDEPYSSGEMYPGQQSVRCRCVETYVISEEAFGAQSA